MLGAHLVRPLERGADLADAVDTYYTPSARGMGRAKFTFDDLRRECRVEIGTHRLDDGHERRLGARIEVPRELHGTPPYDSTAYAFLQQLREAIFEHGIIELPGLPVNRRNHTLAQRSPKEHAYSRNPYLTDICQTPHQDTPPYPTAFWLPAPRRYFATWVLSRTGAERFLRHRAAHPREDIEEAHRRWVPRSLEEKEGVLLNFEPGLVLLDNSEANALHHARTCRFEAVAANPDYTNDAPSYAFNEIGLLHYFGALDERRGAHDIDPEDRAEVERFLERESLPRTMGPR